MRSRTRQGVLPRLEAAARRWPAALSSPLLCSLCIKSPLAHPFPAIPAPAPLSSGFCFASPGPSGLLSRNQMGFFSHSLGTSAHAPLSRFDSLSLCSSSSGPMVVPQMPPPPLSSGQSRWSRHPHPASHLAPDLASPLGFYPEEAQEPSCELMPVLTLGHVSLHHPPHHMVGEPLLCLRTTFLGKPSAHLT